jgi:hypothetical protein
MHVVTFAVIDAVVLDPAARLLRLLSHSASLSRLTPLFLADFLPTRG